MRREITIDLHQVSFIGAVTGIFCLIFSTLHLWILVQYPNVVLGGEALRYADVQSNISVLAFFAALAGMSLLGLWKVEL